MRIPSVMLLGVASGLSVFGMSIVVPSTNSIAEHFDAGFASVQFVISAYLFGLALAQPISGILCDRFGRRPVMLSGFVLFTLASLVCIVAPTLSSLVFARFLQAVGVSVGAVTARAVLRDTRDGEKMAEAMSYISAIMGVAPVLAPLFGGFLDSYAGFRSSFLVTAAMGAIVLTAMHVRLSETLSRDHVPPGWRELIRNYRVLLTSPQFVGNTLIYGFKQGAFFCFLAVGAPFFLTNFGMDAKSFGMLWGLLAMAYVGGATLGAKLTPRIGTHQVMRLSIWSTLGAGILMFGVANVESLTPVLLLLPMVILMVFAGSGTPGAQAGAVAPHPTMAGTASGLSNAVGLVVGGSFTVISGALYNGEFRPIGMLIFTATLAAAMSWMLANYRVRASA